MWNDGLTIVNPEWLNQLPGSFRWNGLSGQTLIYRMKSTANLTISSFIPAGSFFRGNPCNLNIYLSPVLSCSYIGKIPVHRKKQSGLYTKDTLEFVSGGLSVSFICIFDTGQLWLLQVKEVRNGYERRVPLCNLLAVMRSLFGKNFLTNRLRNLFD